MYYLNNIPLLMNSLKLYIVNKISCLLPETRTFGFKRTLYRWAGAKIGKDVRICSSVKILGVGVLSINDNTWVGPGVIISCSSKITIGANCDIAPCVYIGDGTHKIMADGERVAGDAVTDNIIIGDGSWICVNATILPGVSIGRKCVVAAGAVVTSGSEDMKLLAGVPAKVIKDFNDAI